MRVRKRGQYYTKCQQATVRIGAYLVKVSYQIDVMRITFVGDRCPCQSKIDCENIERVVVENKRMAANPIAADDSVLLEDRAKQPHSVELLRRPGAMRRILQVDR